MKLRSIPADDDYYLILQVDPHAHGWVIGSAYQTLMTLAVSDTDQFSEDVRRLTQAFTVLSDDATRKHYDRDVYPAVLRLREMLQAPAGVDNMVISSDSEESDEDEQDSREKHDAGVMANFYNRKRPTKFEPVEYNNVKLALTNMVSAIHKKIKEVEETFQELVTVPQVTILPRAIGRSPHRRYENLARQAKARLDCVTSLKRIRLVNKLHGLLEQESATLDDYCDYFKDNGRKLRLPAKMENRSLWVGMGYE